MTTKDSTGDRLVASIRRTRSGAGKTADEPAAAKSSPATKARAPAKKRPAKPAGASGDNYRSGGRVWPD